MLAEIIEIHQLLAIYKEFNRRIGELPVQPIIKRVWSIGRKPNTSLEQDIRNITYRLSFLEVRNGGLLTPLILLYRPQALQR